MKQKFLGSSSTFKVSCIIDVNLDGSGSVVVHNAGKSKPNEYKYTNDTDAGTKIFIKRMLAAAKYATNSTGKNESIKALLRLEKKSIGGHLPEVFDQMYDWEYHSDWGQGVKNEVNATVSNTPLEELMQYRGRFIAFDGRINKVYSSGTQSQMVYRGDANTKTTVKIRKVKKGTDEPLEGAKFVLFNATLRKYLTVDKTLKTTTKTDATKTNIDQYGFDTNKKGIRTITNIPPGIYEAIEVKAPEGYKIMTARTELINSIGGTSDPKVTTIENESKTIDIQIKKVDSTDTSKTLPKAGFTIKNTTTGKYINKSGKEVNSPQEIFTGSDGYIKIVGVPEGKYEAVETTAPQGYKLSSKTITVSTKGVTTVKNIPDTGQLDIVIKKVDSKTSKPLSGAGFTIRNVTTGKYINSSGQESDTPVQIYTGSDGYIRITNVPEGNYEATETTVPEGYKASSGTITISTTNENVVKNDPEDPEEPEIPSDGLVKVLEVNGQATSYPVKGLQFGIKYWEPDNKEYKVDGKREPQTSDSKYWGYVYHSSGYWRHIQKYVHDLETGEDILVDEWDEWVDTSYYTYEYLYPGQYMADHAEWEDWKAGNEYYHKSQSDYMATATSQENGSIALSGFRTDGSYTLYEIGSSNPYFEVEGAPKEIMSGYRNTTNKIISNERTYVDIEGNVFLDFYEGKKNLVNNVFDAGEGINGVKVSLKNNGVVVSTIASGKDSKGSSCAEGHYKFWGDINNLRIRTRDLSKYTIEFEYNGLKYESVPSTNIGRGNGSKAIEDTTDRSEFNYGYSQVTANSTISGGISTNKSTRNGRNITYKSSGHKSEVIYKSSDSRFDDTYYADEQYHIQASTGTAGLNLGSTGKIGGYPYDPSKDSIEDINFGICEREQPDIALASDLYAAEVSINGYSEIYKYKKRYQLDDESAYEVTVKASNDYKSPLTREVYKSDLLYTQENDDDSQLNIYLTYKVVIKNQSSSIDVTVDNIVDYFSSELSSEIVGIGTELEESSELPEMSNGRRYEAVAEDNLNVTKITTENGYNKAYIDVDQTIEPGRNYSFYIQLKMKREAIISIINTGRKDLRNVVELNTCSATEWTAVDKDSAVGNCLPGDEATMEDDTDYSPVITIKLPDPENAKERKITGVVFEDSTKPEFLESQVRNGDGKYDAGETLIDNVKIELIDIDRGNIAKVYPDSGGQLATFKSSGAGYSISGIVPGNYIIKYTYGKDTGKYTALQYKSTIYVNETRKNSNYASGYMDGMATGWKDWYLDNTEQRYSDAVDNYNGEMLYLYKINGELLTNTRMQIDSKWNESDGMQHILNGTEIDKTLEIDAFTPHMGITVKNKNEQEVELGKLGDFTVSNVDFGISERARYKVQLTKEINRIQLIRPDGSILRDFTDFNNLPANTKAVKSQRTINRGFVQFEIDTELLETTTLLIEYGFTAKNVSETEYKDENYYKCGTIPVDRDGTVVKLSIPNIIDYVDNELMYSSSSRMITEGKKDITNGASGWYEIDLSKEENKKYLSEDVRKALYENGKSKYNTILISKGLDEEQEKNMLKPGETKSIALLLNKTLVPTKDEMSYENTAEIVEVKKTWGRELHMEDTSNSYAQKLGNLDPTKENEVIKAKDPDSSYTEGIFINPPTGGNKNTTIYVILGLLSISIVATGIILIKKKVL